MSYIKAKSNNTKTNNEGTIILTADKSLKIKDGYNLDLDWLKTKEEIKLFLKLAKFIMSIKNVNIPTAMVQSYEAIESVAKERNLSKNEVLKSVVKELNL